MPRIRRTTDWLPAVIVGLVVVLVLLFQKPEPRPPNEISYTRLLALGDALKTATIRGNELSGRDDQGRLLSAFLPPDPRSPRGWPSAAWT